MTTRKSPAGEELIWREDGTLAFGFREEMSTEGPGAALGRDIDLGWEGAPAGTRGVSQLLGVSREQGKHGRLRTGAGDIRRVRS